MAAFYNENDPEMAAWLRELIARDLIPRGVVDERDAREIAPAELLEFDQVHLFAGIGGWPRAFRLAGWPDDRPVWSGSCPCQPYAGPGAGRGDDDERNLWWAFRWQLEQCRPVAVFGEQVALSAGREWLAGIRFDLDLLGYDVGAADLPASGLGSPQKRQRLFWVGCTDRTRREAVRRAGETWQESEPRLLADRPGAGTATRSWDDAETIECRDGNRRRIGPGIKPVANGVPAGMVRLRGYGNAIVPQLAAEFINAYMDL